MKQKITQILPVEFDTDLSKVSKIQFIFVQNGKVRMECEYPSNKAYLQQQGKNIVDVLFTASDTNLFVADPRNPIYMDTRITLTNSTIQPETEIMSFTMDKTYF